jgi:DnaK suppressor protein
MEQSQLDSIRATLGDEKTQLEKQLAEHGASEDGAVEIDAGESFADSAHATTERGELLSLVEQLRNTVTEVTAALERLDDGTYGKCQSCGETIPLERLEAIPTATLCVNCKQAG